MDGWIGRCTTGIGLMRNSPVCVDEPYLSSRTRHSIAKRLDMLRERISSRAENESFSLLRERRLVCTQDVGCIVSLHVAMTHSIWICEREPQSDWKIHSSLASV